MHFKHMAVYLTGVCCVRKFSHVIEQTLIFGEHKINFDFTFQLSLKNYLIRNEHNDTKLK